MATILFANNASGSLAGALVPGSVSCNLQAGEGALFPSPGALEYFVMTFVDAATGLLNEIVHCTSRTGDTLTIVRAQEGTIAQNWSAGDLAANLVTAGTMDAFIQEATINPTRVVTASGVTPITNADGAVGINRTAGVAVSSTTLPTDASVGQVISIEDLAGNFNAFTFTVAAAGGQSIAGAASVVLNVNRQCAYFRYYGSNIWSVKL